MANHRACFDCLSIGVRLEDTLDNFEASEIYMFSYLSCLLSLYKIQPVSNWGYEFAITKEGFPFSPALSEAINELVELGYLQLCDEYLKIAPLGREEYKWQKELIQNMSREAFIDGACSCLLALPVGIIRSAIKQDPEMKGAIALSQSKLLFTQPGIDHLYEQFAKLSSALGVEVDDLMVPAVVWLSYLSEVEDSTYCYATTQ